MNKNKILLSEISHSDTMKRLMKIMSLNIWGGRVYQPLLEFFKDYTDVDIFCLQEVYHNADEQISTEKDVQYALNIFKELGSHLPEHQSFFRPVVRDIYGIGMFVGNHLKVFDEGEMIIHENPNYSGYGPTHSRVLQWLKVETEDQKRFAVLNVHGLWNGKGKGDSPQRLEQCSRIMSCVQEMGMPTIVCGDFNLHLETDSLRLLEDHMHNLIRKYGITSTRTSLYPKEEKFADYVFTSPDIQVKGFQVLEREVSDHAPLILEFE